MKPSRRTSLRLASYLDCLKCWRAPPVVSPEVSTKPNMETVLFRKLKGRNLDALLVSGGVGGMNYPHVACQHSIPITYFQSPHLQLLIPGGAFRFDTSVSELEHTTTTISNSG